MAVAQDGRSAEPTSEELICQLTRECEAIDPALATVDTPDQRGFTIARQKKPTATTATTAPDKGRMVTERPPSGRTLRPARPGARRPAPTLASSDVAPRADLRVAFVTGSAQLTPAGERAAGKFVAALGDRRLAGRRFRIEGHTDSVGAAAYNLDLSRQRAQAVVDYLVANGADPSRFEMKGYGFDRPLDGSSPRDAANRRVEVVLAN
ncbi:MAG: OmpA family protein [Novosphingobium sp.]